MTASRWQPALTLGILALLAVAAPPADAAEAKLTVEDFAKVERKSGTVTTGVPFAKGALKDVAKLSASVGGKKLPAQFIAICPWNDGSVRWALMDTQVDVPAGSLLSGRVHDRARRLRQPLEGPEQNAPQRDRPGLRQQPGPRPRGRRRGARLLVRLAGLRRPPLGRGLQQSALRLDLDDAHQLPAPGRPRLLRPGQFNGPPPHRRGPDLVGQGVGGLPRAHPLREGLHQHPRRGEDRLLQADPQPPLGLRPGALLHAHRRGEGQGVRAPRRPGRPATAGQGVSREARLRRPAPEQRLVDTRALRGLRPHREKQYLDDAVLLFENNLKLKWKEKGPKFGETNAIQYLYCVYPLCELQHRTGNAEILDLLKEGVTSGIDENSVIECNHLTNLYGWVGFMTKDDAVLKKGESCLARAISGDNPAFYTGNGAWSKETAKRVRYGYLLQYAYWKQKAAQSR